MKKDKETDLKTEVLEKIEKQQIKILPKFWFVLGNIFIALGVMALVFVGIFFSNLIIFRIRSLSDSGCLCWDNVAANFGKEFPWIPLLITMICLGVGFFLLRKFKFVYTKNWGVTLVLVILASAACALLIDLSGVNEKWRSSKIFPAYCSLGASYCQLDENQQCRPTQDQEQPDCGCQK